ncbi:gliding motility lipoprotein GldD [uncultured Sunxiuqinia sp.]|uniref:gliding motility lipoprotein GldD n=1 Tax=uncultured Sunxiuqinia sp. TaxID=1573825 RepID=UPI002AA67796|nr:gliding motility lipoprotein GldD [uncultured Sunxiuqinia sp.]
MYRIFFIVSILVLIGCQKEYIPKPRGYFRIDFPEKSYKKLDKELPYSFDIPGYSITRRVNKSGATPKWITISTPENKADIHISYDELDHNLLKHIEESRKLAYDHSIKADAISERVYINPKENVYGTIYNIEGNAASPIQFFLTDSTKHFLRGALYFREVPNIDSLRPVIDFFRPDIIRLIETTKWK